MESQKAFKSLNEFLEVLRSASQINEIDPLRSKIQDVIESVSLESSILQVNAKYLQGELQQIMESHTAERAHYYLNRLIKALTTTRTTKFSDINLRRWKEYTDIETDSLWILDKRDNSGVHSAGYWGNFIPQIPNQLIRRFTKPGEWVLDTFAGSGTTLIECNRLNRNCLGIELQPEVADKSRIVIEKEKKDSTNISEIITGDCTQADVKAELKKYGVDSVQLIIMHPPYHDIIKFSDDPRDMSNAPDVDSFIELMSKAVDNVKGYLDPDRYLGLVIGDKFSKGEWIPLGFLTSQMIVSKEFMLKSIIVKNFDETLGKRTQKELWRFRALAGGYYIFKHEYIFLFTKNRQS